jgi:hypothetical protein
VEFNRLTINRQLTSWNRLLYSSGGPGFEMGIKWTIVGYTVFVGLVMLRARISGVFSKSWYLACAGAAMLVCCQVLPYELPFVLMALPYLGERILHPNWSSRLVTIIGTAFLVFAWTSGGPDSEYYNWLDTWCSNQWLLDFLQAHRSLSCFAFLLIILLAGPVKPVPEDPPAENFAGQ